MLHFDNKLQQIIVRFDVYFWTKRIILIHKLIFNIFGSFSKQKYSG